MHLLLPKHVYTNIDEYISIRQLKLFTVAPKQKQKIQIRWLGKPSQKPQYGRYREATLAITI